MDGLVRREEATSSGFATVDSGDQRTITNREQRMRVALTALIAMNLFVICGVATVTALFLGVAR